MPLTQRSPDARAATPQPTDLVGYTELPHLAPTDADGTPKPRFVKARLATGDYLMCRVDGFKYEYARVPPEAVREAVGATQRELARREAAATVATGARRRSSLNHRASVSPLDEEPSTSHGMPRAA